jgi:hypothetical protein
MWNTCEMKWCVLGMKPPNLFMYKQCDDVASHKGSGRCDSQRTHNDCFTVNGALGN